MNTSLCKSSIFVKGVFLGFLIFVSFAFGFHSAFAQNTPPTGDNGGITETEGASGDNGDPNPINENTDISDQFQLKNPVGGSGSVDMRVVLDKILNAIIKLLSPVLVLMMVYSGYLFVMARGNGEKLIDAKRTLSYTLIGVVIVVAASGIAHILENTIGAIIG